MVIPSRPADVTPAWLSSVLNIDVRDVDVAPIGTGQTGATYRVSATYATEQPELPGTFAIKLPAQDDAVRERVALGYRSEHAFYTDVADRVQIPIPAVLSLRNRQRRRRFRPAARRHGPGRAGRSDRRAARRRRPGWRWQPWPVCTARPGVIPPGGGFAGICDADARRSGGQAASVTVARMAADITLDKLGRGNERGRPRNPARRNGIGDAVAAGRAEPLRADARRLPAGQHAVRSRPDAHHGGGLADAGCGPARPGSGVLHRDQPAAGGPVGNRARPGRAVPPELLGYGVTDYDLDTCWRDYRLGMLQAPLLTALGCAFATSTERGDEMMLVMLRRGCRAIRELGTRPAGGAHGMSAHFPELGCDLLAGQPPTPTSPCLRPDPGDRLVDGGHRVHARRAAAGGPPSPPERRARPRHPAWAASSHRRCSWSPERRCGARAARPARRRSGTGPRDSTSWWRRGSVSRVRRGDRADQKPRVDVGEGRRCRIARWSETPANSLGVQRLSAASASEPTTIASPGGPGRAGQHQMRQTAARRTPPRRAR